MPDLFTDEQSDADFVLSTDPPEFTAMGETPTEESAPERPRDAQGRFAPEQPAEEPAAEEPAAEAAPEEEAAPEIEDPILSDYLSRFDGDQLAALKKAAHEDALRGQQAQELGDLRSRIQEWEAWGQQVQQPQFGATDWDSMIEENPAQAAKLAASQRNQYAYQKAVQAWDELAPGAPEVWAQNLVLQQQMHELVSATREREGAAAVADLQNKYPDFNDMADTMQQIAPEYPYELQALASDDPRVVAKAVESLYLKAKGLRTDTLSARAQEIARKQTEAELQAREEASVASATRSHGEPPPTREEKLSEGWYADEDRLSSGWNI